MALDTRYGFPREDWDLAKRQAKDFLVACARSRRTTTYGELTQVVSAIRLKTYSWGMMAFLDEICTEEDALHGVMLASLVCRKDSGMPGDGYFRNAAKLGRDTHDHEAYWRSEIERIYAAFPPE